MDYKIYDISKNFLSEKKEKKSDSNILIVDIDEKSLALLGQWPWPRILLAELISEIHKHKPTAIGLDIIFPEKDRTSPLQIQSFYNNYFNIRDTLKNIPKELEDNDLIFSQAILDSNSILSIYLSQERILNTKCTYVNKLSLLSNTFVLQNYPYALCNTPKLFNPSSQYGFININMDEDGLLRRYQLLKRHQNMLIPSFSLAVLLNINANLLKRDNTTLEVMGHQVKIDKYSNVMLHYYNDNWYKKVSAVDILNKSFSKEDILGKVVLLGSSAIALHDTISIPNSKRITGVKVHATVIDNILHDDLLVQPQFYQVVNILLSLFMSLLIFVLLVKQYNRTILVLFFILVILSVFVNLYALSHGTYISIGYFILPFLIHFFLVGLIFIFIDTYERKVFSEELNRSHIALVDSMVHVAEVHDIETGAHIIRTKLYIKALGEYIYSKGIYKDELSEEMVQMMYMTASTHDIGKVGIPDSILKKEGKLTKMEYEVMKTHPDLGKHILNNAISSYHLNDFFIVARNIAEFHHEKWDGTGYPKGIEGKNIPIEARFMALADVYDALVSKRVYKEAYDYDKTIKIIKEGRGKYFDPLLVDAFLEIQGLFKKIAKEHKDN